MNYALVWVIILIAFGIIEGMTASMVSIWFCVGTVGALISLGFHATLGVQIGIFACLSVLSMALLRPFAKRILKTKTENTNADRILEAEAMVTEPISNRQETGQIRVNRQIWTARSAEDLDIPAGTQVKVLRIEGVKAIVTPLHRKEG